MKILLRSRRSILRSEIAFLAAFLLLSFAHVAAQEIKETVSVDDADRTYVVRLPRGYDSHQHYPVVVVLHGMNQDTDDIERITRFNELADKDSIIAVYPSARGRWNIGVYPERRSNFNPGPRRRYGYPGGGYPGGGYPGGGYPGGGYPGGGRGQGPDQEEGHKRPGPADDIAFFNNMLDQMEGKYSVDSSRIYVTGLSAGGLMAIRAGCAMSDRIAAIAPVGAAMPKKMICVPTRPVPAVFINGSSDPIVPYGGGNEKNFEVPVVSAEDSAKAWARIDRCSEKPSSSKVAPREKGGMETKVDTFEGCQQNAAVTLYSIKGAGNTWPGGEQYEVEKQIGKTSQDLNANETIWSFLVTKKLVGKDADNNTTGSTPVK